MPFPLPGMACTHLCIVDLMNYCLMFLTSNSSNVFSVEQFLSLPQKVHRFLSQVNFYTVNIFFYFSHFTAIICLPVYFPLMDYKFLKGKFHLSLNPRKVPDIQLDQ